MLGGTIINVITGLIFFGLIGYGVYWVMKTTGQAGQQYVTAMVNTKKKATTLSCQMNLRSIAPDPPDLRDQQREPTRPASRNWSISPATAPSCSTAPTRTAASTSILPGHRSDDSAPTVVVYESKPVHNGKCNVLFSDGQIVPLTPEELKQALEAAPARRP